MSDPYLDAVSATGAAGRNEEDPYLAAVSEERKPDPVITGVRLSALEKNPEQAIAARRLGRQYGLPSDIAEAVLPELKKRAASEQADSILQRSPKLTRFIGADPDRGVSMVDDLPVFGEIERTLGAFPGRRRGPVMNFRPESEEARKTRDRFDRALRAAQGSARATEEASMLDPSYLGSRVAYGYQRTAKPAVTMALNDLTGLYDGDDFGLALRLADSQRTAEGSNLLTPPKSVTEGAQRVGEADGVLGSLGAVLGSPAFVLDVVLQSIGSSSPSLVAAVAGGTIGRAGTAVGAGGGSLSVEYTASILQSMQESGRSVTSAADVLSALRDPEFMERARTKALTRGVAIGAFDALTAGLAGSVIRNARGASRAALVAAAGGEAALQAAGGAGGELLAQALTESKIKWAEVWLEGIAEIASGAVEVPSNLTAARRAAEARFAAQDHGAMVAERNAAMVKELSAAATAAKTLARDPQTLQDFIDTAALEGGRVEDVFVDARTFAQTVGEEKLAELRQASPTLAAQVDEALAIGGDLVIPLGEFVTTIGQSDVMPSVLPHIRAEAADMSLADAKTFMQGRDEQMLAEAEKALEQAGVDSELARSSATVEQSVLAELTTAARFTPAVNERYAKLVSAFFTTMAQRTGMTPEAFAERYKLRVRNEAAEGRTLTAVPVTETPEFKNWFGDSKVIDNAGQPLVVYHGTNQSVTEFDPARVGLRDAGFFGAGFYFTPDETVAQEYADSAADTGEGVPVAMPLYVALQNPFVWDMSEENADATRAALAAAGIRRTSVRGNSAGLGDRKERETFNRAVREQGYDGVVVLDEDGIQEIVAFNPTQIKSIFNRGTFDPTAASILAQPVSERTTLDDFKPGNLSRLLSREDWAIVTAHNPMNNQLTPEENAARNERLAEELQRRGIHFDDSIGKYVNDAKVDPPEDGFILFGVTHEQAHEIGNLFEQDSVLINRGLLYHDNTLHPADGTMVEHAEAPDNYFTRVPATGGLFTLGIDFSQRVPYVRTFAQPADRGRVDNVAVVHYSKEPRTSLASWFYGRGMKGAEYARVMASSDLRLRERVHFYVSAGQPIVPESDVGTVAHTTTVSNLYDADLDHLKLRRASKNDANAFESAILDAGYDGYISRSVFNNQGAVVMLGRRSVDVTKVEGEVRLPLPPSPRFTESEMRAREIASHKALPTGAASLDWWAEYLPKVVPELAALIPAEAWARMRDAYGTADVYRSDLAKLFEAPEITRSFAQSVSTRVPRAVKSLENPLEQMLVVGLESAMADPKAFEANVNLMSGYEGFRFTRADKTPAKKAERMIQHMVDNLLWLHDQTPAEVRQRARLWYDGARVIAERFAERFGYTDSQIAAVLAVLSPQKDWFMNVTLAERVLDIYTNRQDFTWSPEMTTTADDILGNVDPEDRLAIEGRTLRELDGQTYLQALWLRTYDQAHNPRTFRMVDPSGEFTTPALNYDGETGTRAAWGSFSTIGKAIEALRDGSLENVSGLLGFEHKVRNFYNNIFNPGSLNGDVTIDTHAVAAALLQPLAGSSPEVVHNFGGTGSASSKIYGTSGTYGIYAEAFRRAAAQRGLLAREMQSITWEAVRGLFRPEFKRANMKLTGKKNPILAAWADFRRGKENADAVRSKVRELAGGLTNPPWFGPRSQAPDRAWASSYSDVLLADGRAGGTTGPGDGSVPGSVGSGVTRAFQQPAYHGTPHKFDRFTLDAIGSGEGVQAFGWGLYFTSKRDIAEWYRRKLTDDTPVMNWKIGSKWVIRDEAFIDYSPRDVNSSADQAWSASAEALLIHERDIKDAFNSGGLTAARAEMLRIMDETIEIESGADARSQFLWHLGRIRTQVSENLQFDMGANLGQLYEANIPDPDVMLHWDRPLSDQPEAVRAALGSVVQAEVDRRNAERAALNAANPKRLTHPVIGKLAAKTTTADSLQGQTVYEALSKQLESDKAASEYLNSLGIKGISYPAEGGKSDARNFVVFDDSAIEVMNTFYQEQTANRGQIAFGEDITRTPSVISLFEQANLSTFLHESGHFFLEVMSDMASRPDAPADVAADVQKLMAWFGLPDIEAWRQMSPDQQRPHHERFARAFEAYLFEGKAPTQGLAAVFGAFRAWLVAVYRNIAGLNVELTDEIRGVMDRMLATEQQIKDENDRRMYTPLFATAEEMGATAAEWAAYQRAHGDATENAVADMEARSLRDMRWLSGARSREITRLQAEAKEARAAVEAEARAEVRAEPVYAAMRWLKFGEMVDANGEQIKALAGFKLDIEAVRLILAASGRDIREMGFGKYGMVSNEGLSPQVVADMFGFANGETLVHSILNATPEAEAVEALTDQRMLERYGELVDQKAIERAADAAVHNEARGKFVATELRALAKALNKQGRTANGGSVNLLAKAAKDLAQRLIARKKIGEIKPNQFSAAETRAARAAQKALIANDLVTAVTEKRNQLVNFYATREAQAALGRFEMGLRKMKKALASESIDQEYSDQIAGLLDRYSLRPLTKKEAARRKSLVQWVESQKAAGYEPVIDDDILNEARRVPIREITMEEFDGLVAAVENIAHLGRLKKKLLTAKDAREFAERVAEAEQTIRDNATRSIPEALEKTRYARFKSGVKEFFVMHVKFANTIFQMDGWKDGGPLWELFVRPMNEAGDREAVMREQATIRLSEMFKKVSKGSQTKVFIPEINAALSAEARMVIALNTGNAGNLQRLMDGDGWTMEQVQAVVDTLTKEQMDFVQEVLDMIDEYRPMIGAQQKRITGVEPEWVEATPIVTRHGTYRGGYFPAKYDTDRSTRSLSDEAAAGIMDQWRAARGSPKTRDSFAKKRAAKVTQRPLRKDFGVVTQHVTEVAHRLAWQDYLIDANRLLAAGPIDAAIREHYGPEVLAGMRDAIKDIATGEVGAQNAFESAINHLRVGTTIVGLGWNLVTGMLQPFGLTQSMVRVGPKWVAKGLAQWLGDAVKMESTVAAVYAKSDFMRLRGKTMQREISEIRNIVSGKDSRLEASYFFFIQKLQVVADMPTWLGMYSKAIESMNASEETAVALADQAVLDSQSGGQVKDLAAIQRGGPLLKLFTNFYSFFNTTFNLTRTSFGRTNFRSPVEGGLFAVDMLLLYTIPAVMGTLMKAALQGDLDDEDELARKLAADQMNYLLGTMVGLREIGGATSAALGLPSGYGGPAGVRFFAELQRLAKQVEQGEADAAFFKALNNSAGILFHYPAGQINRTIEGTTALLNGETDSPAALIVGPPK